MRESDSELHPNPTAVLILLAVLVIACFAPLLRYFLSQDDFVLIYLAVHEPGNMIAGFFGPVPHHFRPLTKFIYFAVTYRLFGLHPLPYHVVALLVHLTNTLLVFLILRRLRITVPAALVATALFAMNVAFFHIIAWVSCIQQLLGNCFFLLSIYFALRSLDAFTNRDRLLSVSAYLLALLSIEQSFAAPILIVCIFVFGLSDRRIIGEGSRLDARDDDPEGAAGGMTAEASAGGMTRHCIRVLGPHFLLLAAYSIMRVFWKGMPEGGISRFAYGHNILENVRMYLGVLYDIWTDVGGLIFITPYETSVAGTPIALTPSHVILVSLLLYHFLRRRTGAVVFGVLFIALTLLPALFLIRHYFYYHTYVPALGAMFLLALLVDDLFTALGRLSLRPHWARLTLAALATLVIAGFSYERVRINERAAHEPNNHRASFVLRRAIIAGNAYQDLATKFEGHDGIRQIHMLPGRPGQAFVGRSDSNVIWALGRGRAVNLFLGNSASTVSFSKGLRRPEILQRDDVLLIFYDRDGHCYSYEEIENARTPTAP